MNDTDIEVAKQCFLQVIRAAGSWASVDETFEDLLRRLHDLDWDVKLTLTAAGERSGRIAVTVNE